MNNTSAISRSIDVAVEITAEEEISVGTTAGGVGVTDALLEANPKPNFGIFQVQDASIRQALKTVPTTTLGIIVGAEQTFTVYGRNNLKTLRMIAETGTAKVFVQLGRL